MRFDSELRSRIEDHLSRHDRAAIDREGLRVAAVAVVIVPDDDDNPCFVITRRSSKLRRHGGQWALPGGRRDGTETSEETALRELKEEVGVSIDPSDVIGLLDDYETRSGFSITPVVAWGREGMSLSPDPNEVAAAYRVPLRLLDRPEVPQLQTIPESDRPVISIPMLGTRVHAPTAAILFQLREVAIWGRNTRVAHYEQPVFAWR